MKTILGIKTRDCALKIKMHYYFETPISVELLHQFDEFQLTINRFSQYVKNAYDHFVLYSNSPAIHVAGHITGKELVVTFGKMRDDPDKNHNMVLDFEKKLIELKMGDEIKKFDRLENPPHTADSN